MKRDTYAIVAILMEGGPAVWVLAAVGTNVIGEAEGVAKVERVCHNNERLINENSRIATVSGRTRTGRG